MRCLSFKGTYESGIASYKHMYFNATQNSLKIWILIVLGIIALYECTKLLIFLIIQNKVRYSMILLFGMSIFSHYYGWWAYINYYNDEFYSQWNHQLFFTVSARKTRTFFILLFSYINIYLFSLILYSTTQIIYNWLFLCFFLLGNINSEHAIAQAAYFNSVNSNSLFK